MNPDELAKPENLEKAQAYVDFVKNNLEPLADHLKVSVEWLWNILVMQARVEAIVYLIVVLSTFATSVGLSIVFFKHIKHAKFKRGWENSNTHYVHRKTKRVIYSKLDDWSNRDEYDEVETPNETNVHGYVSYVSGGLMAFMILVSATTAVANVEKIVTGLVNPQFRAIEKIVEYAKPAAANVQGESK